jgi:hypothetical protein
MIIDFSPPPTGALFMRSQAPMRVLKGPVGSAKTTTCLFEVVRRAGEQRRNPRDGLRHTRALVVRNTARQLADTTIKTWLDWFPDGVCGHYMKTTKTFFFVVGDVRCEVMFRALDDAEDVSNLLSLELTFAFLNECREVHPDILEGLTKRVGRFPSMKDGGPTWHGIWGDTNPPTIGSWWWCQLEKIDPEDGVSENENGWDVFHQPSGRSREAENIENLVENYYSTKGRSEEYIRVYIDGEYGHSLAGKPVFSGFSPEFHCATSPLRPIVSPLYPLTIGFDAGLTPAAVITQLDPMGRLLVLGEATSDDMGARRFSRTKLKPLLYQARFAGLNVIIVTDPAAKQRSQADEESVIGVLRSEGFKVVPAPTNDLAPRINAVDTFLQRQIDGGPGILLDPSCRMVKAALMGGYHRKLKDPDTIHKDKYSHPAEALQYACLRAGQVAGGHLPVRREIKRVSALGWT